MALQAFLAQRRVDLGAGLMWIWAAFWELNSERVELGRRIPFTALDRYADRYGVEGIDEFERFRRLIRDMDLAYLEATDPGGAQQHGKLRAFASGDDPAALARVLDRFGRRDDGDA